MAGSHVNSLAALVQGRVDAAALSFDSYEKAVRQGAVDPKRFKVIAKSSPIPYPPIAVSSRMAPKLQAKLRAAFADNAHAPGKTPEQAPPGKMPAPMPAPTDVGGVQGPPAKVEAPPAKIVDPAPPVKAPPTQVAGDKGGPVQQAPTQVPTQVAGDKGGPVQQVPTQSPVQQSPIQGGGPVQGDVKLSDNDGRASAELKSASGNSVEIWGDPHVKMNLDGKTENFTIGYGPGSVQLTDGTTISWNTREDKHLGMFKVDRPGTAGDQQVDSKDGTNAKDLQTFLNDDQLREFGAALKSMEGPWDQPLKVPGGGPAQVPQK